MKRVALIGISLMIFLVIAIVYFSPSIYCKFKGGNYKKVGMAGNPFCVINTPDSGKDCTDSDECYGRCEYTGLDNKGIFESSYLEYAIKYRPGDKLQVKGKCEENNNPFKCVAEVKGGYIETSVACLD